MKGMIIAAAAALVCLDAAAQADKIESLNRNLTTVEAYFSVTKTFAANGRKTNGEGTLYFETPGKMAMVYTTPPTDRLIINDYSFYLAKGAKKNTYDTRKNAMMRNLSSTLINCTLGKLQTVADENDAEISVRENGANYDVVLKARRKGTKGYSEISLSYRRTDGILNYMKLTEFNGNSTEYRFSGFKLNGSVAENLFRVPVNADRKATPEPAPTI